MQLTLLGRHDCHLCDEAAMMLLGLRERFGFEISAVDIDNDDEMVKVYGLRIPVIIDEAGRILAEGAIELASLQAALAHSVPRSDDSVESEHDLA